MARNKQKRKTTSSSSGSGRRRDRRAGRKKEARGATSSIEEQTRAATPLTLGLGAAGLVVAVVGFWMVAQGSIALAPVLLVLAYLVLFPLALVR
ncbi:MAG: hypothetical protein EA352_00840 [Gemmatimonadales bacterium]|nr:MAG: hypothetical protein EA352_00840 [Gemmatimonadales bacterium]